MMIKPPIRLRTEYLNNPLGVDTPVPRFSWIAEHEERNQFQTAYQILVSSDNANLILEKGDVWDSGKVASDQTTHVAHAGIGQAIFLARALVG